MKTLYLECNMGAAGDMLAAALLGLVPERQKIVDQLNSLGIPGTTVRLESSVKCGISGIHMAVSVDGEEEQSLDVRNDGSHDHGDEHHTHHEHHEHDHQDVHDGQNERDGHHHHTTLADVNRLIDGMPLEEEIRQDIRNVYQLLGEAEGHAHGIQVDQVHFHEVGTLDAVLDVTAVCLLIHEIHPDQVMASPVRTGYGEVRCAHGIMPVPAPAAAFLLEGIPTYAGRFEGEMCTPTGAALLKYYVKNYGERPLMRVERTGYGMGTKNFPAANCVRAFLGETQEGQSGRRDRAEDRIAELRCNIDDMTGEEIGYAVQKILDAGARDVFTTPVAMKKNRPGVLLTVICSPEDRGKMAEVMFRQTTTIGIRETVCSRYILNRREAIRSGASGKVRVKTSTGYGVVRTKPEYEDLVRVAETEGKSLVDLRGNRMPEEKG